MQIHQILIVALGVFLTTGCTTFILALTGYANPTLNPKQVSYTPIALFSTLLGLIGMALLILSPSNFKNGNRKLAEKQLLIGFAFLFACYLSLELLFAFSF